MNALYPVIFAIVGALLYALTMPSAPGQRLAALNELARLTFMDAMLALMFLLAGHTIHLF